MGYLDGINQYMEEGYAHRVSAGRSEERKFTIKDVYNILDTCLLVCMAHKTDPLLTDIRNKYGMEYLKDFDLMGVEYY
jgi:penicillin amidase